MDLENNDIEELPQALIEDLKARDRGVTLLTARVDRDIEAMAAAQFAARPTPRHVARPAWTALAASVLVAVLVLGPGTLDDEAPQAIYADVDNSGSIDIADVLYFARQREFGQVSQNDIDAFAMQVVSLANWEDAS